MLCIEWFSVIESCIARLQDNRRCWYWWSSLHSDKTFDRTTSISLFSKPKKTILTCSVFRLTPYWIVTLCELHAHRTDVRNRSVSKMAPAQLNLSVVCSQANVSIGTENEAILTNPRKCGLWASIKNSNIGTGFCVQLLTRRWPFRLGLFKIQDLLLWTELRQAERFFFLYLRILQIPLRVYRQINLRF